MGVKKEIVYPFLLECVPYCTDNFWQCVFEDLAYAKPPTGSYISKNFLCCSYKNKEFSYKLQRKDPELLYNEIYTLLTEKLGTLSQKEKLKKKLAFQDFEEHLREAKTDWSSIRKKSHKDMLYERYVLEMKEVHNLSMAKTRYLLSLLVVAIMFKCITSKDIEFSDNKIQNINGILIENGEITLTRSLCHSTEVTKIIEEEDNTISKNWESFVKLLRNKAKMI